MTLHRRLGNKMFVLLVRLFFGGSYSDLCYGYNAFWADVPGQLDLEASGFEIETMMNIRALRAGLQVVEVPSFEHERIHGEGRLRTIPDGWRVLKTILSERFKRRKPAVLRELARPPIEPERLGRELARPSIEPERLEAEIG